ncbi:MAG: Hsp20/alpha crystallin family protein [Patescibacteria group bacterium]
MASFFEKLKKGMGVEAEISNENLPEEKPVGKPKRQRTKKVEKVVEEKKQIEPEVEQTEEKELETKENIMEQKNPARNTSQHSDAGGEVKIAASGRGEPPAKGEACSKERRPDDSGREKPKNEKTWSQLSQSGEGQLAIDVYQTEEFLVLQSAIAGIKPESLDIVIEGDMMSIKGNREKPEEKAETNYFYQECFWGPFSRQIILSVEVDASRAEAVLKEGILTIRLPRIERDKKRKLVVKG